MLLNNEVSEHEMTIK